MKIGLVVDGRSEVGALTALIGQIEEKSGNKLFPPLYAPMVPDAPVGAIGRACMSQIRQFKARGVDRVIVLIDREQNLDCCGKFAMQIESELRCFECIEVFVVIKDRTFENWLVADPQALHAQKARFQLSIRSEKKITNGKADRTDAYDILSKSCVKKSYEKVRDSKKILEYSDAERMAKNSRSFRKFLRSTGHSCYLQQSRQP